MPRESNPDSAAPTNNDIENLELVTPGEHFERHDTGGFVDDEHAEKAREAAKEWHQSDDGREWHQEHWDESLGKEFTETEKECDQCGETFTDESSHDEARFCSNACKAKYRRESGVDDETRLCQACRQPFTVNKYSDQKACGRRCAGALISWSKRVGGD